MLRPGASRNLGAGSSSGSLVSTSTTPVGVLAGSVSLPPRNDFPTAEVSLGFLERGCAGFGDGVVLIPAAAAHADRAHDLAVLLKRNAAGENHDLAVFEAWMPKNCPPDCECVARSLVVMSNARDV